jgi:hypothetical protein
MVVRQRQETSAPVTLGRIRSHGCRDLLVYCISGRCHHSATLNGDWLSDEYSAKAWPALMIP